MPSLPAGRRSAKPSARAGSSKQPSGRVRVAGATHFADGEVEAQSGRARIQPLRSASVLPADVVWRAGLALPPSGHGMLQAQAWGQEACSEGPPGGGQDRGAAAAPGWGGGCQAEGGTAMFVEGRAGMLIWKLVPWETRGRKAGASPSSEGVCGRRRCQALESGLGWLSGHPPRGRASPSLMLGCSHTHTPAHGTPFQPHNAPGDWLGDESGARRGEGLCGVTGEAGCGPTLPLSSSPPPHGAGEAAPRPACHRGPVRLQSCVSLGGRVLVLC